MADFLPVRLATRATSAALAVVALLAFAAPAAAAVDATTRAALARLPGDALLVAELDVKAVRGTRLFRRIIAAAEKDGDVKSGAASLKADTGFDYKRHVDRIWMAIPADAVDGRERMAFLAKVTVNQARFLTWLRKTEKVEQKASGAITYYKADEAAWAFLGDGWLLLAHADYVDQVLRAHSTGSGRAIDDAAMMTAIRAAARSSNHAWFATVMPSALRSKLKGDAFMRTFADLEWSAASATFGRNIVFRGEVRAATVEAAAALAGALTQVVQVAAGNKAVADAGLAGAFSAAVISARDRSVSISGSFASAALAAALARVLNR